MSITFFLSEWNMRFPIQRSPWMKYESKFEFSASSDRRKEIFDDKL